MTDTSKTAEVDPDRLDVLTLHVVYLSHVFGVTFDAAAIRAHRLGLMSAAELKGVQDHAKLPRSVTHVE